VAFLFFQVNCISAINDVYWLTCWLPVATLALAFTLPGRMKIEAGGTIGEEVPSPTPTPVGEHP
jgi:hypothetical protein